MVLAGLAAFYVSLTPLRGGDFWLLAKIGSITRETGRIPDTLLFPFTEIATDHFNAHEWLSAILFSVSLDYLTSGQLIFLAGALGLVLYALLVRLSWRNAKGNVPAALLGAFAGLLAENYRHVLRPELLSLLVMAVFWMVLEAFASFPKRWHLAAAMLLAALWANLHGSFPLAIVLAAIYTVAFSVDAYRSSPSIPSIGYARAAGFALVTLLVAVGSCINPFGLELLRFAFQFGTHSDVHPYITDWLPRLSAQWLALPMFWLIIVFWLLILASLVSTRKEVRTVDWLVFVFFTVIAIRAIRFPVYLGFLLALYLPRALTVWMARLALRPSAYSLLGVFLFAVVCLCSVFGNPMGIRPLVDREFAKISPGMELILKDPARSGNVLNSMELGGELIYLAYPRMKPAMDSRLDSYGLPYYQFVGNQVYRPAYFPEFIQRYNVQYIFLTQESFAGFVELPYWTDGSWKLVFADSYSALIERKK
jgi:hypothetical protein